jgi:hypothetical protein
VYSCACAPLPLQFTPPALLTSALQHLVLLMQSRYSCSLQQDQQLLQDQSSLAPRLAAAVTARSAEKEVWQELQQVRHWHGMTMVCVGGKGGAFVVVLQLLVFVVVVVIDHSVNNDNSVNIILVNNVLTSVPDVAVAAVVPGAAGGRCGGEGDEASQGSAATGSADHSARGSSSQGTPQEGACT